MTSPVHRRYRRTRGLVALVALAALLTGCVSVPSASPPQVISTFHTTSEVRAPSPPTSGQEPDLLIRDFIRAAGVPVPRHAEARQYLTPAMNDRWEDTNVTIVQRIEVNSTGERTDDRARFTVRASRVGQLGERGVFTPQEGDLEIPVTLIRVDGEWRIDDVPQGVVMESSSLLGNYEVRNLYFLSADGRRLVPDQRWISSTAENLPGALLNLLTRGPRQSLAPGVTSRIGHRVTLRHVEVRNDGDVTADVGGLDPGTEEERAQFAAQVVWTLSKAGMRGPFHLLSNGEPLEEAHRAGWTTADIDRFVARVPERVRDELVALVDGAAVTVGPTSVVPLAGPLGTESGLVSASRSHDGRRIAAVAMTGTGADRRATLSVVDGGGTRTTLQGGQGLTRPTWSADDSEVWTVVDGREVRVLRFDAEGAVSGHGRIDVGEVRSGEQVISELRLSDGGTRAAMIIDGRPVLATVVRDKGADALGGRLVNPAEVARAVGDAALSLDWRGEDWLLIGTSMADRPAVEVSLDGSQLRTLPSFGIAAPVTVVMGMDEARYLADTRTLLELSPDGRGGDSHWREVPGLQGRRAAPVPIG